MPWTVAGTGIAADAASEYNETASATSPRVFADGWKLMDFSLEMLLAASERWTSPPAKRIRVRANRRNSAPIPHPNPQSLLCPSSFRNLAAQASPTARRSSPPRAEGDSREDGRQPGRHGGQRHGAYDRPPRRSGQANHRSAAGPGDGHAIVDRRAGQRGAMAMAIHTLGYQAISMAPGGNRGSSPTARIPKPASARFRRSGFARCSTKGRW